MPVPEEVVQPIPEVQVYGTAGRGIGSSAGRQHRHPGGQFPLGDDSAHHHIRCDRGSGRLLLPASDRHLSADDQVPDFHIDLSGHAHFPADDEQSPVDSGELFIHHAPGGAQPSPNLAVPGAGAGHRRPEAGGHQYAEHAQYPSERHGCSGSGGVLGEQRVVQPRGHAVHGFCGYRQLYPGQL